MTTPACGSRRSHTVVTRRCFAGATALAGATGAAGATGCGTTAGGDASKLDSNAVASITLSVRSGQADTPLWETVTRRDDQQALPNRRAAG